MRVFFLLFFLIIVVFAGIYPDCDPDVFKKCRVYKNISYSPSEIKSFKKLQEFKNSRIKAFEEFCSTDVNCLIQVTDRYIEFIKTYEEIDSKSEIYEIVLKNNDISLQLVKSLGLERKDYKLLNDTLSWEDWRLYQIDHEDWRKKTIVMSEDIHRLFPPKTIIFDYIKLKTKKDYYYFLLSIPDKRYEKFHLIYECIIEKTEKAKIIHLKEIGGNGGIIEQSLPMQFDIQELFLKEQTIITIVKTLKYRDLESSIRIVWITD